MGYQSGKSLGDCSYDLVNILGRESGVDEVVGITLTRTSASSSVEGYGKEFQWINSADGCPRTSNYLRQAMTQVKP
jgi:hypothetical protein